MDQNGPQGHGCEGGCAGGACRPAVEWRDPTYLDEGSIDAEMRRVFEVCGECRICEDLCESFPRLFNLLDAAPGHDVRNVSADAFKGVVDACTLCDMCYPVCPYRPPHDYAVDFPSLMVRYRALEKKQGKIGFAEMQLGNVDRNGSLGRALAPVVNWATRRENRLGRAVLEKLGGVHRDAWLPVYEARSRAPARSKPKPSTSVDTDRRKVVIYHNCLVEYNKASIGEAAAAVLKRNGIDVAFAYPGCCGMPSMERGDIEAACRQAEIVTRDLIKWIDDGYDVVSLIPSCTFMLKSLYPMYLPGDEGVTRLAGNVFDICEYVVALASEDGLAEGLKPLDGGVALHVPCHARSQEMGPQAALMLRMIPQMDVLVLERCSGHGGTWGVMQSNFEIGLKVGAPVARMVETSGRRYFASECPLAGEQILQSMEIQRGGAKPQVRNHHPIEILAMSYGIGGPS